MSIKKKHPANQLEDPLLDASQAAAALCITPGTLRNWLWRGKGPKHIKINGRLRYRQSEIKRYIKLYESNAA
jgi:predicted site-specific integrase-resolvase